MEKLETIARRIQYWLFSDSNIEIELNLLINALRQDLKKNGQRLLSAEECESLVCGGVDGDIPAELVKLYPVVNKLIQSFF